MLDKMFEENRELGNKTIKNEDHRREVLEELVANAKEEIGYYKDGVADRIAQSPQYQQAETVAQVKKEVEDWKEETEEMLELF